MVAALVSKVPKFRFVTPQAAPRKEPAGSKGRQEIDKIWYLYFCRFLA
jgi:hypothetical protein